MGAIILIFVVASVDSVHGAASSWRDRAVAISRQSQYAKSLTRAGVSSQVDDLFRTKRHASLPFRKNFPRLGLCKPTKVGVEAMLPKQH
jgi:hypothetical protein